ncbi:hypothetical protein HDV57DRAFT_498531 [Trichoderma longibrachiatum]
MLTASQDLRFRFGIRILNPTLSRMHDARKHRHANHPISSPRLESTAFQEAILIHTSPPSPIPEAVFLPGAPSYRPITTYSSGPHQTTTSIISQPRPRRIMDKRLIPQQGILFYLTLIWNRQGKGRET